MKELQIKNMVCPRCIMAVEQILELCSIPFESVVLGKAILTNPLIKDESDRLEEHLLKLGFSILKDKESKKIAAIKSALVEKVQMEDIEAQFSLSIFVRDLLGEDYSKLSHMFSSVEGITIEQYFIRLKVEKIKEWLSYGELNVSESAYKLGYSSVQHLSSQFKKVTGMSPTEYKKLALKPRHHLDEIGSKKPDTQR